MPEQGSPPQTSDDGEPASPTSTANDTDRQQPVDDRTGAKTDDEHTLRQDSQASAVALPDAVHALLGAGSVARSNIFIGTTNVGSAVAGDLQRSPQETPTFMPSGPVSSQRLTEIERTFAAPAQFHELRKGLRKRAIALLRAAPGWGRTTAALHLLNTECSEGVHKLSPDVEVRSLNLELLPNHGYLLESLDVNQAAALRSFHLEQLSNRLAASGSRMLVLLDSRTAVHDEIDDYIVNGGDPPKPMDILRRHLAWQLRSDGGRDAAEQMLAHDDLRDFLGAPDLRSMPARELERFAVGLAKVRSGKTELADVLLTHSAGADREFGEWFEALSRDCQAFVIALAVFNQMPLHMVSTAGRHLAASFQELEIPDERERAKDVFGIGNAKLIDQCRAEFFDTTEPTQYGYAPVRAVKFLDDGSARRVLKYVWQQYDFAYELVRQWLHTLGSDVNVRISTRAGVAVGLLAAFEFDQIRQLVIEPWVDSGQPRCWRAAVGALQVPAMQPELMPLVIRMMTEWSKKHQPLNRQVTAVTVLGSPVGQLIPERALAVLRRVAGRASEPRLVHAVTEAVVALFREPTLRTQLLTALLAWTDPDARATVHTPVGEIRRITGLRCALAIASWLHVDAEQGTSPWPAVVWLAESVSEHRNSVVTLLARLIQAQHLMTPTYREIRVWVHSAEGDPALRRPLARLLGDVGRESGDLADIRYELATLAEERKGPRAAVNAILTQLDEDGSAK